MSINTQQLIGAHILSNVRALERAMGVDTIRSLDLSKRGYLIRPGYPQGTPAKRHKRNRREEKRRARWIGLCRAYNPDLYFSGNYPLRLD